MHLKENQIAKSKIIEAHSSAQPDTIPFALYDKRYKNSVTKKFEKTVGDRYLQQYPHLLKWINVCVVCGKKGYKPELPENIYTHFNVAADNLRELFQPLSVNELGLCEICTRITKSK